MYTTLLHRSNKTRFNHRKSSFKERKFRAPESSNRITKQTNMSKEKIKYGSISVIKCYRNVYLAKTTVENEHCRKMEVEMKGSTAEIAR